MSDVLIFAKTLPGLIIGLFLLGKSIASCAHLNRTVRVILGTVSILLDAFLFITTVRTSLPLFVQVFIMLFVMVDFITNTVTLVKGNFLWLDLCNVVLAVVTFFVTYSPILTVSRAVT